jgi:DNA helicase IV
VKLVATTTSSIVLTFESKYPRSKLKFLMHSIFSKIQSIYLSAKYRHLQRNDKRRFGVGFKNWLPNQLTETQILAITSHFPKTFVVAGAGSGKTTLLLGRAKYLVESGRTSPERILALAFNKSAAKELAVRAQKIGVPLNAQTFHGFGNAILNSNGRLGGVAFSNDQEIENFFIREVKKALENDSQRRLLNFFCEMLIPFREQENFKSIKEYNTYAKAIPVTFANERVKSHGELIIANYLFQHGVSYRYEQIYDHGSRNDWHKPDFTIESSNETFYIEYFGVDRKGDTAPYVDREKYNLEIAKKRATHLNNQTTLIELTYQDLRDGVLIQKLEAVLRELGVTEQWRTESELIRAANEIGYVSSFVKLCQAFLSHARARRLSSQQLKLLAHGDKRTSAFLEIFSEFLEHYEAELSESGLPDFSAMILDASDMIFNQRADFPFDHVLVDEYQDISADRQCLIDAMSVANPKTEFLYVGDDWQSINRFAGADISILRRASRRGLLRRTFRLAETHRFPQSLADISSQFIQKNPDQIKKSIVSTNPSNETDTLFIHTDTHEDDHLNNLKKVISRIGPTSDTECALLIVARYKDNLPALKDVAALWNGPIDIRSIHSSKGAEADYVIVMDLVQDWRGFPSTITDDPILELVLPESEKYPYAEERRLFYVALTRARVACHLIAPLDNPSLFTEELIRDKTGTVRGPSNAELQLCPLCRSGILMDNKRSGGTRCSNSPTCIFKSPWCEECCKPMRANSTNPMTYECVGGNHSNLLTCPKCGWGVVVKKTGRFGEFQTCSNYFAIGCDGRNSALIPTVK